MSVLDFVPLTGSDHAVSIAGFGYLTPPGAVFGGRTTGERIVSHRPGVELVAERRGRNADRVDAPMAERVAKATERRALICRCRLAGRARVGAAESPPARDTATAPLDRLTHRQAFVVGHRQQRLPCAPLSVPD